MTARIKGIARRAGLIGTNPVHPAEPFPPPATTAMKTKLFTIIATSALTLIVTARAQAPASASANANVRVLFEHPETYTDLQSANYSQTELLDSLRTFVVQATGPRLAPGNTLTVTFADLDLAGTVNEATANRRMKSTFPPRAKFSWAVMNANGSIVRQDTEDLSDPGFLTRSNLARDPLFYEKQMLQVWARRTFR
jgi:hypothetical protein